MTIFMLLLVFTVCAPFYFKHKMYKGKNSLKLFILLCLLIAITYEPFLVRSYPKKLNFYNEKVTEVAMINKWFNMDGVGLVYIKDLEVVDNKLLRIHFRRPGLTKVGILGAQLYDATGKIYIRASHGIHMGLLISSGIADYRIENGYGKRFYLELYGDRTDLSK